jgi:hypothetical protein
MTRLRQRLPGKESRRAFIRTTGAALSVPLAAAAATVPIGAAGGDAPSARLAMLEDLEAIRALNQAFARLVSEGEAGDIGIDSSIRSVVAHEFGERDLITIAADRQTATGVMHCTVQIATPIGPTCPLVEMAREQGGGVVIRTEIGVFENEYSRRGEDWTIQRSTYRPAR